MLSTGCLPLTGWIACLIPFSMAATQMHGPQFNWSFFHYFSSPTASTEVPCVSLSKKQTFGVDIPPRERLLKAPAHPLPVCFFSHLTEPWHSLIPVHCCSPVWTIQLWKSATSNPKKLAADNEMFLYLCVWKKQPLNKWFCNTHDLCLSVFHLKGTKRSGNVLVLQGEKWLRASFKKLTVILKPTDRQQSHPPFAQVCTDVKMLGAISSLQMIFSTFLTSLRCLCSLLDFQR